MKSYGRPLTTHVLLTAGLLMKACVIPAATATSTATPVSTQTPTSTATRRPIPTSTRVPEQISAGTVGRLAEEFQIGVGSVADATWLPDGTFALIHRAGVSVYDPRRAFRF